MGFGDLFDEYAGLLLDKNQLKREASDLGYEVSTGNVSQEDYEKESASITDDVVFAYEKGVITQMTAMGIINSVMGDTSRLFEVEPERECNPWDEPDEDDD